MRELSPKNFIVTLAENIKVFSRDIELQLTNSSVVLRKRLRDLNDDDRTGIYSPYTGNWTSIDQSGIYSENIVKPTIRANTSAMSQAKVRISVEPRFTKDAESESASQVALAIVEQAEREQWSQFLEEYLANEQQLGAGVFLRTFYNPNKTKKRAVERFEEEEVSEPGVAVCPECGTETQFEEVNELGDVMCEACGTAAMVVSEPQAGKIEVPTGVEEFTVGSSDTQAYPFFEFRVDTMDTQGGNIEKAKWFEHHRIVPCDELALEYPESAQYIEETDYELSYPLKWQQTLLTGKRVPELNSDARPVRVCEVRDIWVTPSLYLNVKLSEDLKLKDKNGKIRFEVKKGQTFAEAKFEGEGFDEPPVLCFRLVQDELLDVYPSDFRKEFSYLSFLANPSTFWALFATELITLQDIVNYMLTIQMYHIRRNAITSIVYNRGSFDPEGFDEDLIPTKADLPYDVPINSQFGVIPALTLSQEPMQMLQMIMATKGDITQVQPAMVGEAQPGQPYAAQLLQKQQSLGLLSSATLSKAAAKVQWAKRQLELAKEYWTEEDTAELLHINGEWTEETIQAFLDCDIDKHLIVDFVAGTEIPTTLIEREAKLRQTIMDIAQLASVNPQLIRPEVVNEILTEIMQAGNIDIDINNTEADLRLAESRYDKLLGLATSQEYDKSNVEACKLIAQYVVKQPIFAAYPFEGHQTIIEFYSDKARQEAAKDEPDYLIILCLQGFINNQQMAEVAQAQMLMQQQMMAQAPMMEQQMQMQQAQGEQQAQAQAEQQAVDESNRNADREDAESDRNFQRESKAIDMLNAEADRELQREQMARQAKQTKTSGA